MSERQIFEAALEIADATRREAFLSHACEGQPELREAVDALLLAHMNASSEFLATPAALGVFPEDTQTLVRSIADADDDGPDEIEEDAAEAAVLSFLTPSTKPGSLGRLAHYEVIEFLGRGAFGVVLKAFDEKLHRMVAVKMMNPELAATSPPRKRFLREARSSAAVRHENIVAIYAVEEQPVPYLVMEYIPGKTLQQWLNENGPLEVKDILKFGQQLAAGLAAAHAQSLIHRDIKPANILIDDAVDVRAKITDFGLARAVDDASMTQSGLIAGTPIYMSPEQARGQALDHRTDLFSLGSVLYAMTSGRPPFRAANTIAVLRRVCEDTPRPLREVIATTPDWLQTIIAKLLEKEPADRYQSAKEVADLLARCQSELQLTGNVTSVDPRAGSVSARSEPAESSSTKLIPPLPAKAPEGSRSPLTKTLYGILLGVLVMLPITCAKPISRAVHSWIWPAIPTLPVAENQAGLDFDGKDDSVEISPVDWSYPQFTIEAFVTSKAQSDNGMIVSLTSGEKPWEIMELYDGHPAALGQRISGAQIMGKTPYATAYGPLTPGVRQHRVLVFDGSHMHYYINGIWQGKRPAEAREGMLWKLKKLRLGSDSDGKKLFEGQIDQLRISKVARYTDNFVPVTSVSTDEQTLALYNFDEGSGDVLRDASGNGHDGQIIGATWSHPPASGGRQPSKSPAGVDNLPAQRGEWIDVIPLIDPKLDKWDMRLTGSNEWRIEQGELFVGGADNKLNKLLLPLDSDFYPSFECELEVTRRKGSTGFNLNFPTANGDTAVAFDAPGNTGVFLRHGRTGIVSITEVSPFETGKRTTLRIEVRHLLDGDRVTVWNKGTQVGTWTGDRNELASINNEGYPHRRRLSLFGIGAGNEFVFHRIRVRMLDGGSAETLRPVPNAPSSSWHGWPADAPAPAIAPFDAEQAQKHQEEWAAYLKLPVEYTNSIGMKFRLIPPGEFTMGMTKEEAEAVGAQRLNDGQYKDWVLSASPEHRVRLTQPYYLSTHEVTQEQYEKVMGSNPSHFSAQGEGENWVVGKDTQTHPVEKVSFIDSVEFCNQLSKQEMLKPVYIASDGIITLIPRVGYGLPTEAEWEAACRAGTNTAWSHGDQESTLETVAWYSGKSGGVTHSVGQLKSNPFGLYDMHGNVWEWCQDRLDRQAYAQRGAGPTNDPQGPGNGSERVMRGGDWGNESPRCRSAFRFAFDTTSRNPDFGIRVALPIDAVRESLKQPKDPDRELAEWALSTSNPIVEIVGREKGSPQVSVTKLADLPAGEFYVTDLVLNVDGETFSDADLERMARVSQLKQINIQTVVTDQALPLVTDRGIEALSRAAFAVRLEILVLYPPFPSLTDAAIPSINRFTGLQQLAWKCPSVSDAGIQQLELPALLSYYSWSMPFTAESLVQMTDRSPQIASFGPRGAGLSGVDLTPLAKWKLTGLCLDQSGLTNDNLKAIGTLRSLTLLHLGSNPGISREGISHLMPLTQLEELEIHLEKLDDESLLLITGFAKLQRLNLNGTLITNLGLETLAKMPTLTTLHIEGCQGITEAGVRTLQAALPKCQILSDFPNVAAKDGVSLIPLMKATDIADGKWGDLRVEGERVTVDVSHKRHQAWINLPGAKGKSFRLSSQVQIPQHEEGYFKFAFIAPGEPDHAVLVSYHEGRTFVWIESSQTPPVSTPKVDWPADADPASAAASEENAFQEMVCEVREGRLFALVNGKSVAEVPVNPDAVWSSSLVVGGWKAVVKDLKFSAGK